MSDTLPSAGPTLAERRARQLAHDAAREEHHRTRDSVLGPRRDAETLRGIAAEGKYYIYRGAFAQKLSQHVQRYGGWITPQDMANHTSTWDEPITANYRGVTVWECPPNGQGLNALMALNIAEGFDIASMGHQSVAAYHHLIESMRVAYSNGLRYIADPRKTKVPLKTLLSKEYATTRRAFISPKKAIDRLGFDPNIRDSDTIYCTVNVTPAPTYGPEF